MDAWRIRKAITDMIEVMGSVSIDGVSVISKIGRPRVGKEMNAMEKEGLVVGFWPTGCNSPYRFFRSAK